MVVGGVDKIGALDRVKDILTERAKTHGDDALLQLMLAQQIKRAVRHRDSATLTLSEMEAIDAICVKLARLVAGKPMVGHWEDLIGYGAIGYEARSAVEALDAGHPE